MMACQVKRAGIRRGKDGKLDIPILVLAELRVFWQQMQRAPSLEDSKKEPAICPCVRSRREHSEDAQDTARLWVLALY